MNFSNKYLCLSLLGLTLLFPSIGSAQEMAESCGIEYTIVLTIEDDDSGISHQPMCLNNAAPSFDEKHWTSSLEESLKPPQCHKNNDYYVETASMVAHKLCKGTVGGIFGGSTGKLLTHFLGGQNLVRLIEIAGVSEISGHSSGLFICENLFGEGQALDTENIDWLLEPDIIAQISSTTFIDTILAHAPKIAYEASNIAVRGTFVFFIIKKSLGIANPVAAFILGIPLRGTFDAVRSQLENIIQELLEEYIITDDDATSLCTQNISQ